LLLFARNIVMVAITNWARGAVYWNLVLDENHGPHSGGCDECKGVVTIDSATGNVSRNDEYYAFAHFSRFVLPGAVRVKSGNTNAGIHEVAFQNPHGGTVVLVAVNGNTTTNRLSVKQGFLRFQYDLPASSVATFEWAPSAAGTPASAASSAR
jgi:glucosylceramidase